MDEIKLLINVFDIINKTKSINKQFLFITNKDEMLFINSYIKNKQIRKKVSYTKWRNCIINYSINNMVLFPESIKYFEDYIKNNNQ